MTKKKTKKDLINILVEEYGYEQNDIKMLTNAKLELLIKQEEEDKEVLEARETLTTNVEKFKDDDQILVMNGFSGALTHRSGSTGRVWDFAEFGQTRKMPYSELLNIHYTSPKVFKNGWLVIMNRQIQEDFGLTDIYKNILTPENIDKVFEKDIKELDIFIDNLPEEMKVSFIMKAKELYRRKDKRLDSKSLIDFIEGKFGISLEDNAPLSDTVYDV